MNNELEGKAYLGSPSPFGGVYIHSSEIKFLSSILDVIIVHHVMVPLFDDQKTLLILNETAIPHDRERDPAHLLPHCWRLQDCYSCLHSQYHCSWCAIVRTLNASSMGIAKMISPPPAFPTQLPGPSSPQSTTRTSAR